MERLRSSQQVPHKGAHPRGVPAPLRAACLAEGSSADSLLRVVGQPAPAEIAPALLRSAGSHAPEKSSATPTTGETAPQQCPPCGGTMRVVERLTAKQVLREEQPQVSAIDSSSRQVQFGTCSVCIGTCNRRVPEHCKKASSCAQTRSPLPSLPIDRTGPSVARPVKLRPKIARRTPKPPFKTHRGSRGARASGFLLTLISKPIRVKSTRFGRA